MRFDWYASTIPARSQQVISALETALGCEELCELDRGLHGYRRAVEFIANGRRVASMLYDGNANANPHAWASGEDAVEFASVVRSQFPDHKVTRADSAIDFDGAGTWDKLLEVVLREADASGLKVAHAGDWHRGIDGRTVYLGAPSSAVRVRLYEKGKQLGADLIGPGADGSTRNDWCRLEVMVRPDGDARRKAAYVSPEELWGFSRSSRNLLKAVNRTEVPRVVMRRHRVSDAEAAFLHMVQQYASALDEVRGQHNWSWDDLGLKIGELVERKNRQLANKQANREATQHSHPTS